MSIGFNGNDYGVTRQEWKAIRKELKAADKKNDNYELTRADVKEIKSHIKTGDLGEYLEKVGIDMKRDLGLALTGKVDGSEDIKGAQKIVEEVTLGVTPEGKPTDKAKVIEFIRQANAPQIAASFNEGMTNVMDVGTRSNFESSGILEALENFV